MKYIFLVLTTLFCGWLSLYAQETLILQNLANQKKYSEILFLTKELSKKDSANISLMFLRGQAYEGLLKYRNAYGIYQYCYENDSTNIDILNTLARTAINLGKATDAEKFFQKVLLTDTANFYANYQLGRMYFQIGDYEKAIEKYDLLLEEDEDNSTILRNLGDCYSRKEDLHNASYYYFKAYNYNRENAGLALNLINTLLRMGPEYCEDALSLCDTALYYNPQNIQLERNKGLALHMNKNYAKADTLFTQLMQKGDSSYITLKYAGAARYYAGQYYNSIDPLEAAYKMDTTSVEVCLLLGSALGKTYDRQRAYSLFKQAEENMQPAPFLVTQLTLYRGETYQKDGRYAEASKLYYQIWKDNPKRIDLIQQIRNMYFVTNISEFKEEEIRQRGVFIHLLFTQEILKRGEDPNKVGNSRKFFESLYEDMFFRNITETGMLAPDGKKNKITVQELQDIIKQLPEAPTKGFIP